MTRVPDTSAAFFEGLYQADPDPWDFACSPYETARYERMLAALEGRHFHSAYEPGCSIGAFTERLAPFCSGLVASDASATAVARARARVQRFSQVSVTHTALPEGLSPGLFDLIVFSEIGYYFERPVLQQLVRKLAARLQPGGVMLGCHWLGESKDHVLPGAVVHTLVEENGFTSIPHRPASDVGYQLDLWTVDQ